jgi:hypothetical protein
MPYSRMPHVPGGTFARGNLEAFGNKGGTIVSARHFQEMPRFFFNTPSERGGQDIDGLELPDSDAAWQEAAAAARELFKAISHSFPPDRQWVLEVTDEYRTLVYRIRITGEKFSDHLLEGRPR